MVRKEQRRLEEESQYTYTPKIKEIERKKKDSDDPNSFHRLYIDAMKRHIEKLDNNFKEKSDEKDVTFKPEITAKARSISATRAGKVGERLYNTPVHRVGTEDSDNESQCSFQPSITKRAKSIERNETRSTGDRLYHYSKVYKEKRDRIVSESNDKLTEKCTFNPRTNTPSKTSSSRSSSRCASPFQSPSSTNNIQLTERMKRFEYDKCRKLEEAIQKKKDK